MSKHRITNKAICPYYKHEDSQMIYCEGVQDRSVLHLAFANKSDAKEYKKCYCQRDYAECLIEGMLERKELCTEQNTITKRLL